MRGGARAAAGAWRPTYTSDSLIELGVDIASGRYSARYAYPGLRRSESVKMMRMCCLGAAGLLALAVLGVDADRLLQQEDVGAVGGTTGDAAGFHNFLDNFGDGDDGAPPPPALSFGPQFDDHAVLQQKSGGDAWVYGTSTGTAAVTVKVSGTGCASLTVTAEMSPLGDEPAVPGRLFVSTKAPPPPSTGNKWKAKVPGAMGGDCTITATDGTHTATIQHVTYGDVWYCGG